MSKKVTLGMAMPEGQSRITQPVPAPRILVVEDEVCIRELSAQKLQEAGYQVDAAPDGAAAWAALCQQRYSLVVTDNRMPKLTGMELIEKIHQAELAIPVILASAAIPEEEFESRPWLRPSAVLCKPYTFPQLLLTVKALIPWTVCLLALSILAGSVLGQEPVSPSVKTINDELAVAQAEAVTIAAKGKCEFSDGGTAFSPLVRGQLLPQGAILRTGEDGHADVFFRRTGTTVRLQAGTEVTLEKMTSSEMAGRPVENTLLDLQAGRVFIAVRSLVAGSKFEVSNAAGRAVLEGSGVGRYIITADGTQVTARGSVVPLKVIGKSGLTVVAAGQQFDRKEGKALPASPDRWVKEMIELDQLQAFSESSDAPEAGPKP